MLLGHDLHERRKLPERVLLEDALQVPEDDVQGLFPLVDPDPRPSCVEWALMSSVPLGGRHERCLPCDRIVAFSASVQHLADRCLAPIRTGAHTASNQRETSALQESQHVFAVGPARDGVAQRWCELFHAGRRDEEAAMLQWDVAEDVGVHVPIDAVEGCVEQFVGAEIVVARM